MIGTNTTGLSTSKEMHDQLHITVIIPALNEQASIAQVIEEIPACIDQVIVVDNNSQDATREMAQNAGAKVVLEPRKGYGRACLTGIEAAGTTDILAFINGSYSDYPEDLGPLVSSVAGGQCALAIGCRQGAESEVTGMFRHQRWGTQLVCWIIWLLHRYRFQDLGPLRCISASALAHLNMQDENFGWTVEMQVKAVQAGMTICQLPVRYRKRIGQSKISGTVRGSVMAGLKMFYWTIRLAVTRRLPRYR